MTYAIYPASVLIHASERTPDTDAARRSGMFALTTAGTPETARQGRHRHATNDRQADDRRPDGQHEGGTGGEAGAGAWPSPYRMGVFPLHMGSFLYTAEVF